MRMIGTSRNGGKIEIENKPGIGLASFGYWALNAVFVSSCVNSFKSKMEVVFQAFL